MLNHRSLLSTMKRPPVRVDTVVISAQHDPDVSNEQITKIKGHQRVIPASYLDAGGQSLHQPYWSAHLLVDLKGTQVVRS